MFEEILTYEQIYKKFIDLNPSVKVIDYRPYSLCENSIIVWVSDPSNPTRCMEYAFEYIPELDMFVKIKNAVSYAVRKETK